MNLEKQVKSADHQTPLATGDMNADFNKLEQAIDNAIGAIQTLRPAAVHPEAEPAVETMNDLPPEQAREVAGLIRAAAEMGDVTQLKSIAAELASQTEIFGPISEKITLLAAEFDFDGIAKFADELERQDKQS